MGELVRFNSLFDDTFLNDFFWPRRAAGSEMMPAIDVHETDTGYLIKADLPGVSKEDIKVSLDNGVLTISAETRHEEKEEQAGKLIRQERRYGKYSRAMSIGADIDAAQIKARFEDGVLSLSLPKLAPEKKEGVHIDIE